MRVLSYANPGYNKRLFKGHHIFYTLGKCKILTKKEIFSPLKKQNW